MSIKRLFQVAGALMRAPFVWLMCAIRRDRLRVYPGQVIQIIGLPGTGKTMTAHAMISRSKDLYYPGALFATEDAGSKICKTITLKDLATHKFQRSLIMIDESSLNGLDARDWQHNFRGDSKNVLRQIKLVRHYHNAIITTSQSAGDNDSKLRGLSKRTWVCHKLSKRWIICKRAVQWFEWQDGNYLPHLDEPSIFEMITDPYCWGLVSIRKYGKMYNSWATVEELDKLPYFRTDKE